MSFSASRSEKSMESRLLALESSLGLLQFHQSSNEPSPSPSTTDLSSRLAALENKFKSFSTPDTIWSESDALLQDLHPQAGLTYQALSTRNDPVIYRRQQVLASAEDLKRDFAQLNKIMNTLLISQSANQLSEEHVTNAPILLSNTSSQDDRVRVEKLILEIGRVNQDTLAMSKRVDSLIQTYHVIVAAFSERMLLLQHIVAVKANAESRHSK